ncbi:MAG: hypothetical protein M3P26_04995 [Gemmatimonadota bacterium]|nr:hypothetical protein [Gemmatimonadota bacterium]
MKAELLTLRVVHILGGIFWVGSLIFTSCFLIPVVRSSPAVAGQVMAGLQKRRLFIVLPVVALLTIASGLRLLWIASAGFSGGYFSTSTGRTLGAGAVAATAAFLISLLISRPAFVRVGKLGASLATTTDELGRQRITAEMQRLNRRAAVANATVVVLLLLTAVGMATARYL